MRFALILLLIMIAAQSGAETISMLCNNNFYRYTDKFLSAAKIEIREDASWKQICTRSGEISDRGGACLYKWEDRYPTGYNVKVDNNYINNAQKILTERLLTCRKLQSRVNGANGTLKKAQHLARLFRYCTPQASNDFQTWNFYQNQPTNEVKEFWKLNNKDYFSRHLPKSGVYEGNIYKSEKRRLYLDFVTFESRDKKIDEELKKEYLKKYEKCIKQ